MAVGRFSMNKTLASVPAYILAGGRSSRFGSDKARALAAGTPLLQRLANDLVPYTSSVTVVAAHAGAFHDLEIHTVGDIRPGLGPMGGLATALSDMNRPGWLALIACDWAGVHGCWLKKLQQAARIGDQCVVFETDRIEPLFALYHTDITETVQQRLTLGQRAMRDLVVSVPHRTVLPPPEWPDAANINFREDLIRFEQWRDTTHA